MSKYIFGYDNKRSTAGTWGLGDRNVVKYTRGHRAALITEMNHSNLGLKIRKTETTKMMDKGVSSQLRPETQMEEESVATAVST